VIQGGDPEGTGAGGPGYRFEDELPKAGRYEVGSLAMANAGPNTNGSQFFVISGPDGVRLPPQYSLFGQLVSGRDVLASINGVGTSSGKPQERVVIESVTVSEAD
jgi:cyclophilin family peptidyl-prolyl cis-trans isomerase